jgi:lysophospholipase L1-like esterase
MKRGENKQMREGIKPVSYLALGDSLTEGIGAESPTKSFVSQFFQHIKHSDRCHMRNWGVSGMTSEELLSLVNSPGMHKLFPKMTHISVTTGGCDFIELYERGHFGLRDLLNTSRQIIDRVKSILSIITMNNPASRISLMGFYLPPPAYEWGFQTSAAIVQMMNRSYAKICEEVGCHFFNPYDVFLHRQDYFFDEVHPNQVGHDELAKLAIQTVAGESGTIQAQV